MNNTEKTDKATWKKILEFVVKLIELIIATFFGANLANMFNF